MALRDVTEQTATDSDRRLYFGFLCPYYLIGVANMALVATIVVILLKHSTNLSSGKRSEIAERFLLVFVKNEDLSKINNDRIEKYERKRADKRRSAYTEMANRQI